MSSHNSPSQHCFYTPQNNPFTLCPPPLPMSSPLPGNTNRYQAAVVGALSLTNLGVNGTNGQLRYNHIVTSINGPPSQQFLLTPLSHPHNASCQRTPLTSSPSILSTLIFLFVVSCKPSFTATSHANTRVHCTGRQARKQTLTNRRLDYYYLFQQKT